MGNGFSIRSSKTTKWTYRFPDRVSRLSIRPLRQPAEYSRAVAEFFGVGAHSV